MKSETIKERGFKETEIGLIPEDWEFATLGLVKKKEKYSIVDGPFGSQMKVSEFVNKGIPVIEMENLKGDKLSLEFRRYITQEKFEDIKRSQVIADDIVISKTGTLGLVAIAPKELKKAIITSRLAKLTLDKNKVDLFFIHFALLFLRNMGYWEKVGEGSTMKVLTISKLSNAPIALPAIPEQQKIAAILSKIQQAIEQQDKIIQTTKELKKSLMNKLFTEGLHDEGQKETEIGTIPKSWEVVKICEGYEFTSKPRGFNIKEKAKIPFIPMDLISEESRITDKYELRDKIGSGTFVLKGDLVVAKITPSFENGKQGIIDNIPFEFAYATTEVWPIHRVKGKSDINYLYYYLKKSDIRSDVAGKMEGSTGRQRVPKNVLENLSIPLPSLTEQEEISLIFISLDKKITQADVRKQTLQSLFKTMLNQLMTGRVRVKNLDIGVN